MGSSVTPYLFSVEQFERMDEHLILGPEARFELLYGHIVVRARQNGTDIVCLNKNTRSVFGQIRDDLMIMVRGPLRFRHLKSVPMPDLTILREDLDVHRAPEEGDAYLVGEVSASTIDVDGTVKLPLCAAAGIPEAWLFNLVVVRIERHTAPQPDGYRTVAYAERGQRLASTVLPDLFFDTNELIVGST